MRDPFLKRDDVCLWPFYSNLFGLPEGYSALLGMSGVRAIASDLAVKKIIHVPTTQIMCARIHTLFTLEAQQLDGVTLLNVEGDIKSNYFPANLTRNCSPLFLGSIRLIIATYDSGM